MQNRTNQVVLGLVAILVLSIFGVLAYIGYVSWQSDDVAVADSPLATDNITVVESDEPINNFALMNTDGNTLERDDFAGTPTLMTFGFTHCPDVCPLTLSEMNIVEEGLSERGITLDYVFVTVDPQRDTAQVLATYFETLRVDDFLAGLTGSLDALEPLTSTFGVEYIYAEPDAIGNYNVEHTAGMFLLDSEGEWVRRYRYGTPTGSIVQDIANFVDG
ncbi:MAG: SCO family protein [Chloroflexota bacterium]